MIYPALFMTLAWLGPTDEVTKPAPPDAKQIKKLVQELGSDEFKTREKATKDLTAIGRGALPALREAVQSTDAEVRQRARHIVDAIQSSITYLTESLKDKDPALRKEAAEIIERLGPQAKAVAPALMEALEDKDESVRDAVLNALLAIDPMADAVTKAVPAKARVEGKYKKLLRRIRVPRDKQSYGEFHDYGYFEGSEWGGLHRFAGRLLGLQLPPLVHLGGNEKREVIYFSGSWGMTGGAARKTRQGAWRST